MADMGGLFITVVGDFGSKRSHEKIEYLIQSMGSTCSCDISDLTTHLICSREVYRDNLDIIKEARTKVHIWILCIDWLENSLMDGYRHDAAMYQWENIEMENKEKEAKILAERDQAIFNGLTHFENGCKEFEREMRSDGYHIYVDSTGYTYDITLTRADLVTNVHERHMLKLYESHDEPKRYACFEKHSAPGTTSPANVLAPIGSSFHLAFDHFKAFFQLKTRIPWDRRLERLEVPRNCFLYKKPEAGEPQGIDVGTQMM